MTSSNHVDPHQVAPKDNSFASKALFLDVDELDDYLSSLLVPQVLYGLRYFTFPISAPDIKPILSFITLCISMKSNDKSSPACKALGLKISVSYSAISSLGIYFFLKLILPSLRKVLDQANQQPRMNESSECPIAISTVQVARKRRQTILKLFDATIPLLRLLLILKCWGRIHMVSAAPELEKWLSGLEYQTLSSSSKRNSLHVLYAHRRFVHRYLNAISTHVFIPLFRSVRESQGLLSNFFNLWLLQPSKRLLSTNRVIASRDGSRCPLCDNSPIPIPVQTNCGHVYCYTCLWEYLTQQERTHCQVCNLPISSCQPFKVE